MHLVVSGWFWNQPHTGSGQYLRRLLPQLAAAAPDAQITLLLPPPDEEGGNGQEQARSLRPNLTITKTASWPLPLPRQVAKLLWEQITVPRTARRLAADVLFVPYWASPVWQPIPTVVTVHDVVQLVLPAYRGGWLMQQYTRLVSFSARRAAAILTVSQASKRDIVARLGAPASKVFAVYHGPNQRQEAFPATDPQAQAYVRDKYNLPERYFLYLGGFDVRKNVASIVQAYAQFRKLGGNPDVKLVLAGKLPDRDNAFYPHPARLAAEAGVAQWAHFPGWIDETDKPAVYAGAIAFLFPSIYEGFGMMLLEAMAAGCPVITSVR